MQRRHRDGSVVEVALSMSPIRGADSVTIGVASSSRDIGERRRVQALLAAIVESSQDAIIGKSVAGEILSWNAGAVRLYGWSAQEAVGQHIDLLVPQDLRALERELFARVLIGEQVGAHDLRREHKDGHHLDVALSMSAIRDVRGATIGVASSSRDITERKRMDEELRESQERFRELADHVDVGFTIRQLDPPRFVYMNRAYLVMSGFDAAAPPATVAEAAGLVHPEDLARGWQAVEANNLGRRGDTEVRLIHPDGSQRRVRVRSTPIADTDGTVRRVATIVDDVTERHAAQAALEESEHRFAQLADAIDIGVTLREFESSHVLYLNRAYVEIIGVDPCHGTDTLIAAAEARVHPDDRERVLTEYWPAAAGRPAESEHRIVCPDGSVRWVRATSEPVTDASGAVIRIAGTVEDITDRKSAETAMHVSADNPPTSRAAASDSP